MKRYDRYMQEFGRRLAGVAKRSAGRRGLLVHRATPLAGLATAQALALAVIATPRSTRRTSTSTSSRARPRT